MRSDPIDLINNENRSKMLPTPTEELTLNRPSTNHVFARKICL
jgi:hypothetical protein